MRIVICETKDQARDLVLEMGADNLFNVGTGPFEDVTVEEQNTATPNRIWDYSGLKRHVLVFKG